MVRFRIDTPINLVTERLILRPFQDNDIDALLPIAVEPDINIISASTNREIKRTIAQSWVSYTRRAIRKSTAYKFAVVEKHSNCLVGMTGLTRIIDEQLLAHVGFWIGNPYRGQGYATEAGAAVVHFAFHVLGLSRLAALTEKTNEGARRVLKNLEFTQSVPLNRQLNVDEQKQSIIVWERLR